MARNQRLERRLLAADEVETVEATHYPRLQELSEKELADTIRRLRTLRDRARDLVNRQGREMRGKAAPKGREPVGDNSGSKEKLQVLAAALQRAKRAVGRLEDMRRPGRRAEGQAAIASRALAAKQRAQPPARPPAGTTAGEGMRPVEGEGRDAYVKPGEFDRSPLDNRRAQAARDQG